MRGIVHVDISFVMKRHAVTRASGAMFHHDDDVPGRHKTFFWPRSGRWNRLLHVSALHLRSWGNEEVRRIQKTEYAMRKSGTKDNRTMILVQYTVYGKGDEGKIMSYQGESIQDRGRRVPHNMG